MEVETPSTPTYRIFRDKHGIPQFEPKRGTQMLKDALIYAFPSLETELQLMQAALKKFFDSERGNKFVYEIPENELQVSLAKRKELQASPFEARKASLRNWRVTLGQQTPSRTPSRASSRASSRPDTPTYQQEAPVEIGTSGRMTTWMLSNGQELEKRKRRPYDAVKRRRIAENRGNACEKHRSSKTACDPYGCPENKLYSKLADELQTETGRLTDVVSRGNLSGPKSSAKEEISDLNKQNKGDTINVASGSSFQTKNVPLQIEGDVFWDASEGCNMPIYGQDSLLAFDNLSSDNHSNLWPKIGCTDVPWTSFTTDVTVRNSNSVFVSDISTEENLEGLVREQTPAPSFNVMDSNSSHLCNALPQGFNFLSNALPQDFNPLSQQHSPSIENPNEMHTAPRREFAAQTTLCPPFASLNKPLQFSDDPFMGWASKRASQIFEDYGWVLSHVESL